MVNIKGNKTRGKRPMRAMHAIDSTFAFLVCVFVMFFELLFQRDYFVIFVSFGAARLRMHKNAETRNTESIIRHFRSLFLSAR